MEFNALDATWHGVHAYRCYKSSSSSAADDPAADINVIMMPTTVAPTVTMMIGSSSIGIDIDIDIDIGIDDRHAVHQHDNETNMRAIMMMIIVVCRSNGLVPPARSPLRSIVTR